jgi:hypothetical protein
MLASDSSAGASRIDCCAGLNCAAAPSRLVSAIERDRLQHAHGQAIVGRNLGCRSAQFDTHTLGQSSHEYPNRIQQPASGLACAPFDNTESDGGIAAINCAATQD